MSTDALEAARTVCPADPLDPGVALYVHALREADVHTFESCGGDPGHVFDRPTVKFYGTTAEGWRALAVCQTAGLPVYRLSRAWDIEAGEPSGPYWLLSFKRAR